MGVSGHHNGLSFYAARSYEEATGWQIEELTFMELWNEIYSQLCSHSRLVFSVVRRILGRKLESYLTAIIAMAVKYTRFASYN